MLSCFAFVFNFSPVDHVFVLSLSRFREQPATGSAEPWNLLQSDGAGVLGAACPWRSAGLRAKAREEPQPLRGCAGERARPGKRGRRVVSDPSSPPLSKRPPCGEAEPAPLSVLGTESRSLAAVAAHGARCARHPAPLPRSGSYPLCHIWWNRGVNDVQIIMFRN